MMDEALQRTVASEVTAFLEEDGLETVLVGSTAIVVQGLFSRTTKDVDVVIVTEQSPAGLEAVASRLADRMDADVEPAGWNVRSIVHDGGDGVDRWRVDLLPRSDGPIPGPAADLLHDHAVPTDVGSAARPDHIVAMKAIGWSDARGKGDPGRVRAYESDLVQLRQTLGSLDADAIERFLATFPDARSGPAIEKVNEVFGTQIPAPDRRDIA